MAIKLFSKSKPLNLNDMRAPDPCRQSKNFSDPANIENDHKAAGYEKVGTAEDHGALKIFSDDTGQYRAQKGILWKKI